MEKEIKRDYFLEQLIKRKDNGLIKIVTGIRRCGKSYLLRTLFKNHLLENGVDEKHIIEMSFDLFDNIEYRNPKIFYPWAKEQLKDNEKYYFLLDEVQLLDEFVSVLNGLADKKNCDVFVTGSNAKFLSRDIATEFGGRGDEIHMYPLSFSEFMSVLFFKKSAATVGMNSTPRGRMNPRRINPSPLALRCIEVIPSSRVASVFSAQTRNSFPKRVSTVLRPFFSKRGTPSSFSSCVIAWLRLGWAMQSCSAAFV